LNRDVTIRHRIDWETKQFEDCLEKVVYTRKIQRRDFLNEGKYPVISQEQDFINGYWNYSEDLFKIEKPIVVFGDHTQVLKYVDFDFVLGADGVKILLTHNGIEPKFLYYFLQKINLGSLGYARHYRILKELEVSYPKALPEQRRIVAILDEAFAAIAKAKANAEQNLKNAKELFESYLQGVFENKGEGWVQKRLGDVAHTNGRIGWKGLTAKEYKTEGPLFLSVHSLNYGDYVDFREAYHISQARYDESPEIMLQEEDILICKDGAGIGKLGIVPKLPSVATINSSLLLIRCKDKVKSKYLYYFLLSPAFQSIVQSRLMGATTPHLYQRDIVTFPIFIPNLKEQDSIVEKLDILSSQTKNLETIYKQKLLNLEELKKSILNKAFSGELNTSKICA
jgi:type I restriction enzyme S subunit